MFSKKDMLPEEEIRQVEERLKILNTDFVLPETLSAQQLHKRLTPEDCRNFREAGHPDFMYWQRYAGMVASFIVVLAGLVMVTTGMIDLNKFMAPAPAPEMAAVAEAEVAAMDMDEAAEDIALYDDMPVEEEAVETKSAPAAAVRSRLYASTYGDIVAALEEDPIAGGMVELQSTNNDAGTEAAENGMAIPNATWQKDFSDVPGESSDILKSDGTYFYYYCAPTSHDLSGSVHIIEAETLNIVSTINTGAGGQTELFIRDGRLVVVSQNRKDTAAVLYDSSALTDQHGQTIAADLQAETAAQRAENYGTTTVSVYDLSNITNPVLVRSFMQDGMYQNCRLVGGRFYLFTQKQLNSSLTAAQEPLLCDTLPVIRDSLADGAATLAADRIAVAPGSNEKVYTTVSMFEVSADRPAVTNSVLGASQSYLSDGAVYFCYNAGKQTTGILRMTVGLDMNISGQTVLRGDFNRPMAINRLNDVLRVATVTTDANTGKNQSNIYLLDDSFYPLGSVEGLGQGETVTDLCFVGNAAYITSQRDSRPVLGLDISSPTDPVILGQLEIDPLPESFRLVNGDWIVGLQDGHEAPLKLVFRDLFDSWTLDEMSEVLPGGFGSSIAQEDYRALLCNYEQQVVGFPVIIRQANGRLQSWGYATYRFDGEKLVRQPVISHAEVLNESIDQQRRSVLRGRIIEDRLYTFSGSMVKVHDLNTMQEQDVLRIH